MNRKILVIGATGFIGYHHCGKLLALGDEEIGLDSSNDFYDVNMKDAILQEFVIVGIWEQSVLLWDVSGKTG